MFGKLFSKWKNQNNKVPTKVENHFLYHFGSCPYCFKVRIAMTKLGIEIPMYDIMRSSTHRQDLNAGGGSTTVPCLRIEQNDETQWLYESSDIVNYLQQKFTRQ